MSAHGKVAVVVDDGDGDGLREVCQRCEVEVY